MRSRRSSRRSRADRAAGFSLVELLVTIVVAGVTLASAVKFLAVQSGLMRRHASRLEAQQALRSSLDAITRDVRLAGACLATNGQFVALAGTNAPGGDTITIRTGLVRTNLSCIVTALATAAVAGQTTLDVDSANGFTGDMLAYVRHPNGSGEIGSIVDADATTVTFAAGMSQVYPVGSGVYAVDERVYAVDGSDPTLPVLTLAVNRGLPQEFAAGVRDLQVGYVLERDCPPCDQVDLPADTAEWRLVNSVVLTATVDTIGTLAPTEQATLVASSVAKPRNLLP